MIEDLTIQVSPETAADVDLLKKEIAKKMGNKAEAINSLRILRRSVDARQRKVKINLTVRVATGDDKEIHADFKRVDYSPVKPDAPEIIIVGAGPAGLFAALKAIELGLKPIVLERGKDVDTRRVDIAEISRKGIVDKDSNYCFGEGGAGTYSDGKLFTRSKKRGNVNEILQILYQHGANENILIDAHPHIGSDKLPIVIRNIRNTILECGGEVKFGKRVSEILIEGNSVKGVLTADGERFEGPVILATGHSARDVYYELDKKGIKIDAKPLAIGVRLEHPQHLIDQLQYHSKNGRGNYLPAAEYSFVTQAQGRGVYSFCMCPGGVVVPAASAPGELVVNGMSASARSSQWANSGMVVEIHPEDIDIEGEENLKMLRYQEMLEKRYFIDGGETLNAAAQKMTDFVEKRNSEGPLPKSSYAPGIHWGRVDNLLPTEISDRLAEGFKAFDRKCRGFLTDKAILIGLESRTSSPVRIPRDPVTLEHTEIENLYPAGEGAGYAGGIVSSAIDGQRCVEAYQNKLNLKEWQ